jgi:hypothetical protein
MGVVAVAGAGVVRPAGDAAEAVGETETSRALAGVTTRAVVLATGVSAGFSTAGLAT